MFFYFQKSISTMFLAFVRELRRFFKKQNPLKILIFKGFLRFYSIVVQ